MTDLVRRLLAEMEKQTRLLREIRDLLRDEHDDSMTVSLRMDEPIPLDRKRTLVDDGSER